MRVAVINETSAADRNADILAALEGRGHEIINAGMRKNFEPPELQYIQTGLMTAILLNAGRVDLVVGGCGTGQGFMMSASQYPGVLCGHILTPLDAWLFAQINNGNCISLALNQGYGWAGDVNLRHIFDMYFSVELGGGYPPHRKAPQQASRQMLGRVNELAHRSLADLVSVLPDEVVLPALRYPGFRELIDAENVGDAELGEALLSRYNAA